MTQSVNTVRHDLQDHNALLVFRVGNSNFCTNTSSVVSMIEPPPINKLPLTPPSFAGIIDFYESATPIICLRRYFNEFVDSRQGKGVIIIARNGARFCGYWVDEAVDMISMKNTDFHDRDPVFSDTLVKQFVTNDDQLLLYVDLDRLYKEVTGQSLAEEPQRPADTPSSSGTNYLDTVFSDEQNANLDSKEPSSAIIAKAKSLHAENASCIAEHNEIKSSDAEPANNHDDIQQQNSNLADAIDNTLETNNTQYAAEMAESENNVLVNHELVDKHETTSMFTGWTFKKSQDKESLKGAMTPYILPDITRYNISAASADTLSASNANSDENNSPLVGGTQLPGIVPSNNIVHKLTNRWPASLVMIMIVILFLLTFPLWRSSNISQKAADQQTPSTKNRLTKENTGSISEFKTTVSDTSNLQAIGTKQDNRLSSKAAAKQSDKDNQYHIILGLQSETYSITVERPENNIQQETGSSKNNSAQGQLTEPETTANNDKHIVIPSDKPGQNTSPGASGESPDLNVKPVASARQPVFKGTNSNWGSAQYEEFIYIVVKGDTLWDIAAKYLGDPFKYKLLSDLSYVRDPDWIYPGDIVRIRKIVNPG